MMIWQETVLCSISMPYVGGGVCTTVLFSCAQVCEWHNLCQTLYFPSYKGLKNDQTGLNQTWVTKHLVTRLDLFSTAFPSNHLYMLSLEEERASFTNMDACYNWITKCNTLVLGEDDTNWSFSTFNGPGILLPNTSSAGLKPKDSCLALQIAKRMNNNIDFGTSAQAHLVSLGEKHRTQSQNHLETAKSA